APISAFRRVFGLAALSTSDDISRSCITVYPREMGGLVARPDRALDGGREARRRPVAGEKEIAPRCLGLRPFCVLIRLGGKRRAAFRYDEPGQHLSSRGCDGGADRLDFCWQLF